MIIRYGGGNSGIADYLEHGSKHGRHYTRDELDSRIIIDGDLDVTDSIIDSINDNSQDRYLHITLSFNEPDITPEKMQEVYEDYKKQFLQAYDGDELNTYAEIHWPKLQQIIDRKTGDLVQRHPHVHMVIPKQNLLSGGYANPVGMHLANVNIWDAIQEDVNNRHGLQSPSHSPRVSVDNYMAVLERHKTKEFKRSVAGQMKRSVFDKLETSDCHSWQDFKQIVAEHGELKIRNEGKDNEYLAVKLPGNSKFTNLNNPVFSKQFVETREIPHQPLTQYQIDNRLKQWEQVSLEIKYIDDAGPKVKASYRALDAEQKIDFLNQREDAFYERYRVPEQEPGPKPQQPRDFELAGILAAERRSLHELPTLNMVHERTKGHVIPEIDLLLSADESNQLSINEAGADAGLHGSLSDAPRVIDRVNVKSLAGQIVFDIQQNEQMTKAQELERFKEIRLNLDPELVLAYAQANHLIDPEKHKITTAKDGSARIGFGQYNYNVSDFFTKGIGLEWKETRTILNALYDAQQNNIYAKPVTNDKLRQSLKQFDDSYLDRLAHHKSESNYLKRKERDEFSELNRQYYINLRSISKKPISIAEKTKLRALETFHKLVAEEELKAGFYSAKQNLDKKVYPFSDKFREYLTDQKVIDMATIEEMKEQYSKRNTPDLRGEEEQQQLVNSFGSGKPFDFMTDSKEAARRAKLMADMENKGKPHTQYGYSFKDLSPEQKKDSVVFSHAQEKLFEVKSDRTEVIGDLNPDKVATALTYSLARYGNPLDINGTNEFRDSVVDAAARNGINVEFSDPVLNDALARRIQELAMESGQGNTISAASLELDKDLPEAEAVDKALRESKEREIEADIKEIEPDQLDLAVVAIEQRRNVHEAEPVTAETAELDAALFQELARTPAMQAHFAQDMATHAMDNPKYNAKLSELGVQSEVQLASHGAMKFESELADLYSGKQPGITRTLSEIEQVQQTQADIKELEAIVAEQPTEPEQTELSPEAEKLAELKGVEAEQIQAIQDKLEAQPELAAALEQNHSEQFDYVQTLGQEPETVEAAERGELPEQLDIPEDRDFTETAQTENEAIHLPSPDYSSRQLQDITATPHELSSDFERKAVDIIVDRVNESGLDKVEFAPVAVMADLYDSNSAVEEHGKATMEKNEDGSWTVSSTVYEHHGWANYTFEAETLEQAAANFVDVAVPGHALNGDYHSTDVKLKLLADELAAGDGVVNGLEVYEKGQAIENSLWQYGQQIDSYLDSQELDVFDLENQSYSIKLEETDISIKFDGHSWHLQSTAEPEKVETFTDQIDAAERMAEKVYLESGFDQLQQITNDFTAYGTPNDLAVEAQHAQQHAFEAKLIDDLHAGNFKLDEGLDRQDLDKISDVIADMHPMNSDTDFWQRHESKFNELANEAVGYEDCGLDVLEKEAREAENGQLDRAYEQLETELEQFKQENPDVVERVTNAAENLERIEELDSEIKTDPAKEADIEKSFTDEHKTKLVLNLYNDTLDAMHQDRPDARQEAKELGAAANARVDQIKSRGLNSPGNRDHTQARRDMAKPAETKLTEANVKHKAKAAEISKMKPPVDEKQAKTLAKQAITTIEGLKGRPEVREAAQATASLAAASPAFRDAFNESASQSPYAQSAVQIADTQMAQPEAKVKGNDFEM